MVQVCWFMRRVCAVAALIAIVVVVAAPQAFAQNVMPASAQIAAPATMAPPGYARFWFYRVFFPDDTGGMPPISMNGKPIGYALAGTSFYRDVPAGAYHLTVQTNGLDYGQSQDVVVAPGQQVFVKIDSLPSWQEESRGRTRRGTYYVTLVTPQYAALELPHTTYTNGN
ncbi:MAG TPA: hypothetical protein VHW90_03540 [Stellaceae bacterium]|nr:hypothetical protein [Stellaceae bacterium]